MQFRPQGFNLSRMFYEKLQKRHITTMAYAVNTIIEALKAAGGLVHFAADRVGCTPKTIYAMIERNPTVREAWEAEKDRLLDHSELGLKVHILAQNMTAITYHLDRKGRDRGYVKTISVEAKVEVQDNADDATARQARITVLEKKRAAVMPIELLAGEPEVE